MQINVAGCFPKTGLACINSDMHVPIGSLKMGIKLTRSRTGTEVLNLSTDSGVPFLVGCYVVRAESTIDDIENVHRLFIN